MVRVHPVFSSSFSGHLFFFLAVLTINAVSYLFAPFLLQLIDAFICLSHLCASFSTSRDAASCDRLFYLPFFRPLLSPINAVAFLAFSLLVHPCVPVSRFNTSIGRGLVAPCHFVDFSILLFRHFLPIAGALP